MKTGLEFTIEATDGAARTGRLETRRGSVATPAFMPVGTAATIKAMTPEAVAQTGAEIILCNTYHLMLRPGAERVAKLGGLHRFMNWSGPILTDSGGFQVMSLAKLRQLDADGVTFQSHIDGASHRLTPERAIEIQHLLNADIAMVLDECTPWPVDRVGATASMQLSMRWAERSKAAYIERPEAGLFGIVQGSVYPELRKESAGILVDIGFDGYAIGGLAVGEGQDITFKVLDATMSYLPDARPRYLMGVGRPADILGAVRRGVDMFDCVLPTRSGRTGKVFTRRGELNIRNARHADDPRPLDEDCPCPACGSYGRAYLHHLFKADEMLGPTLLTWHNLTYYQELMAGVRAAIKKGGLEDFAAGVDESYEKGDVAAL